jgi:hypothetical protein
MTATKKIYYYVNAETATIIEAYSRKWLARGKEFMRFDNRDEAIEFLGNDLDNIKFESCLFE